MLYHNAYNVLHGYGVLDVHFDQNKFSVVQQQHETILPKKIYSVQLMNDLNLFIVCFIALGRG